MRIALLGLLLLAGSACSGGDEPSDDITRIDGPAVVDENDGAAEDPADG